MSITHRLSKTPLYTIFHSMKGRCYNTNSASYKNYGGRGIKICEEWLNNFELFYHWAINNGWRKGLEIDRINVNGNYCPNNCRFVPRILNARNTTKNKPITYNGQTKCLSDWCHLLNMNYSTMYSRIIVKKLSPEEAFSIPTSSFRKLNKSRSDKKQKQIQYCRPSTLIIRQL